MVCPCQDPTALLLCFPLALCPSPWMSLSFPCPRYPWWNRERWMAAEGRIPTLLLCSMGPRVPWGVRCWAGLGMG